MPTYEYRCVKGHEFDLFQRMSDEPKAACPECGEPAQRLLSAGAGFLFKGDGFYITDYRSDEYKKAAKADGGNGSKETKGGGKGTKASGDASGNEPSSGGGSEKPKKAPKPEKGTSASSESS